MTYGISSKIENINVQHILSSNQPMEKLMANTLIHKFDYKLK